MSDETVSTERAIDSAENPVGTATATGHTWILRNTPSPVDVVEPAQAG
jgi:hypothetical protein